MSNSPRNRTVKSAQAAQKTASSSSSTAKKPVKQMEAKGAIAEKAKEARRVIEMVEDAPVKETEKDKETEREKESEPLPRFDAADRLKEGPTIQAPVQHASSEEAATATHNCEQQVWTNNLKPEVPDAPMPPIETKPEEETSVAAVAPPPQKKAKKVVVARDRTNA